MGVEYDALKEKLIAVLGQIQVKKHSRDITRFQMGGPVRSRKHLRPGKIMQAIGSEAGEACCNRRELGMADR
jgi:hypothetical protein